MKYFTKTALRRWAREIPRLSFKSVERLNKGLPKGTTGSTSRKPLGAGKQGKAYPSFTAGKGQTAVKVFNNPDKMSRTTSLYMKRSTRQHDMAFAKVHSVLPRGRGHVMERLKDVPKEDRLTSMVEAKKRLFNYDRVPSGTGAFDRKRKVHIGDLQGKNVMVNNAGRPVFSDPAIGGKNIVEHTEMLKRSIS